MTVVSDQRMLMKPFHAVAVRHRADLIGRVVTTGSSSGNPEAAKNEAARVRSINDPTKCLDELHSAYSALKPDH